MSERKDGGLAFPKPYRTGPDGMSLRDWFAGQALTAIVDGRWSSCEVYAESAYRYADAMLAARNAEASK